MFRWIFARPRRGRGLGSLVIALGLALSTLFVLEPTERGPAGFPQVIDGDSLRLSGLAIRLKGVDAPEMQQTCERGGRSYRCGEAAKEALVRKIAGGPVECRLSGRDRYGRSLAFCRVGDVDVGAWLVEEGFAVGYGAYEREEARARARRAGLWAGSFERPNAWRQNHCGIPVNPDVIAAQVEGAVGFTLSSVLRNRITLDGGRVQQANFDSFEPTRMSEMPKVEVYIVPSTEPPTGIGEPGVPTVAPAVANAVFAATGKRLRSLPLDMASLRGV